jgi:hypothetical protein
MHVEIFFHARLCSMHKSAKRVNIGRNSKTDSVRYQRWRHLLVLVHVNCLETTLESFLGSIRAKNVYFVVSNGNSLPSE